MRFNQQLIQGKLIKRYKRFLADVEPEGCFRPDSRVWLSGLKNET